jgi:hypothetical protein
LKKSSPVWRASGALLGAAALLAPPAASAQTAKPGADDWKFRASIYGWLPSIDVKSNFSVPPAIVNAGLTTGGNAEVNGGDILKAIEGVFMGTFEARKGRWGVFTDVMYLSVGGSVSRTRDIAIGGSELPVGATADLDMDLKGWVWTLVGTYQFSADRKAPFQVLAGARLVDVEQKLDWQTSGNIGSIPAPGRQGSVNDQASNWDAIVGVKGHVAFGPEGEWLIPYYVDVGTGQSDLTWQAIASIGYSFKWGEILAAWRYLDYNFKSGNAIESLNFNGPAIGVGFRW